jgi:hypothetical protein
MEKVKTLILEKKRHVLPVYRELPLESLAVRHLLSDLHPHFYYADVVVVKDNECARILKDGDGQEFTVMVKDLDILLKAPEIYKVIL